jgi:hypothetical protein
MNATFFLKKSGRLQIVRDTMNVGLNGGDGGCDSGKMR